MKVSVGVPVAVAAFVIVIEESLAFAETKVLTGIPVPVIFISTSTGPKSAALVTVVEVFVVVDTMLFSVASWNAAFLVVEFASLVKDADAIYILCPARAVAFNSIRPPATGVPVASVTAAE